MSSEPPNPIFAEPPKNWNWFFWSTMIGFGLMYLLLIIAMVAADFRFATWQDLKVSLADERVRYSIWLSLITCTISAVLSMWVAIPTGYLLARVGRDAIAKRFERRPVLRRVAIAIRYTIDTLLDIPIVLPPLVVGISLLVLFQTPAGRWLDHSTHELFSWLGFPGIRGITYEVPAVILGSIHGRGQHSQFERCVTRLNRSVIAPKPSLLPSEPVVTRLFRELRCRKRGGVASLHLHWHGRGRWVNLVQS